jgi:hypothetical protein
MSDIRARFEEIWPVPEGVYWMPLSRNGGEYMADPTIKGDNNRIEAQLSAEEWDARLDTFTRCQEMIGAERDQLQAEIERLKGLQPSFPPRPPEGYGLPRFGLRWNGPSNPLAVSMDDGYWTPWHLADQLKVDNERLEAERAEQWRLRRDVEADRDTKSAVIAELRDQLKPNPAELEAIGTLRRVGQVIVFDAIGDPHIKDGMEVFTSPAALKKNG